MAFEELYAELVTIGVDQGLARSAGEHAERLGLRGYDAVHLATALELGDEEVVVVTWDRDLARATERVGLGVAGVDEEFFFRLKASSTVPLPPFCGS